MTASISRSVSVTRSTGPLYSTVLLRFAVARSSTPASTTASRATASDASMRAALIAPPIGGVYRTIGPDDRWSAGFRMCGYGQPYIRRGDGDRSAHSLSVIVRHSGNL